VVRIRYALRSLAASPSFTIGSILCLSVGLALTIAAFSLINAVLFRSMPGIRDQAALRNVWVGATTARGPEIVPPTLDEYEVYRESLSGTAEVAAAIQAPVGAQHDGGTVLTRAVFVSPNYFEVLGTVPMLGRVLDAGSDGVVVGERFWRVHLGAREDVIGQTIAIGGRSFRIIGITPSGFVGASTGEFDDDPSTIPSLWVPLRDASAADIDPSRPAYVRMTARLAPGTADRMLAERTAGVAASLAAASGTARRDPFVRVRPLHSGPWEDGTDVALAVSGVMVVPLGILAIGCANVANLLLARGASRRRDVAVRLALGASRGRIVGELLTESLMLAGAAAAVAVALCAIVIELIEHWMPIPVAVDWRVAGFAAAAAVVTALLFGLLPAVGQARSGLLVRIHDGRPMRTVTRRLLAGFQLALSTALLVIAALFVRTVTSITADQRGDEEHVVRAAFAVNLAKYDRARADAFQEAALERVRVIGGVQHAGFGPHTQREPLMISVPGQARPLPAAGGAITDGWLGAANATIVAGRDFTPAERRGAPAAALVNDVFSKQVFPGGSALGQAITVSTPGGPRYEVQVVGIIQGPSAGFRRRPPLPIVYLPSSISIADARALWVRTEQPAGTLIPTIRAIGAEIAPGVAISDIGTVADARRATAGPYLLLAEAMGIGGLLALLLAAFGLFSLLTYLVTRQRRELGIRLALGARPADIVRLVAGESVVVAAAGAAVGGIAAFVVANGTRSMFVGVGPADPVSFVAAAAILIAAALAASAGPALRAARTDPSEVLRAE
jgi:predicted permease